MIVALRFCGATRLRTKPNILRIIDLALAKSASNKASEGSGASGERDIKSLSLERGKGKGDVETAPSNNSKARPLDILSEKLFLSSVDGGARAFLA